MQRYRYKKLLIILLLLLVILISIPVIYRLSKQLSKTDRVNANILLIEGWLDDSAIKTAYKEFKEHEDEYDLIITTGINLISHEYYMMDSNGYLIFYPGQLLTQDLEIGQHDIEIDAYSSIGGEYSSKFKLYLNKNIIDDITVGEKKNSYHAIWTGRLSDIDSIMVNFYNDGVGSYGDKNLFIKQLVIDKKIEIPYKFNSEYDIGELDGKNRLKNNYRSYAQLAKNRLIAIGIDSTLIKAVPGKKVGLNRTLSSVLALSDWLDKTNLKIKGINIVTTGSHSKRTRLTYEKVLDHKYNIGVIALPESKNSKLILYFNTIRETIGIVYYWIILNVFYNNN